jgi:hypothetical protein
MTTDEAGLFDAAMCRRALEVLTTGNEAPPRVYWPDIALAFLAGLICAALGIIGAIWLFGG